MKVSDILVEYVDHMGSDDSVASSARVSFSKEASNYTPEQNAKLIKYLAVHKHLSPFNHSFITVRVKAPLFIARQMVKHKFMPWNEVSRRYVNDEPEFYFPDYWREAAANVKQGSSEDSVDNHIGVDHGWKMQCTEVVERYKWMLEQGVCAEQARMVLPQNMMTTWMWSGTLGAYCDMLRLRLDSHTQKESRDVAEMIRGIIEPLFPVSVPALLEIK